MVEIILLLLLVLLGIKLFIKSLKICTGGGLMQGCGKIIFPWQKKFPSSDGFCCSKCYINNLKKMAEYRKVHSERDEYPRRIDKEEVDMLGKTVKVSADRVTEEKQKYERQGYIVVEGQNFGNEVELILKERDTRKALFD